jgi:hypothetical protein
VQFIQHNAVTGFDDFPYLMGKIITNARKSGQVIVFFYHRSHIFTQFLQGAGSIAVSAHAKHVSTIDFQKISDLFENGCDISIMDGHGDSFIFGMGVGEVTYVIDK